MSGISKSALLIAFQLLASVTVAAAADDPALTQALRAVQSDPKNFNARINLGTTLQSLERPADALVQYQQAGLLNKEDPTAAIGQAQCWLSLGQQDKAIDLLEQLARHYPKNTDVLINLSNAYLEARELPDAEATAQLAVLSDPTSYAALRILAEIAFEQKSMLRAISLGSQLIRRFPQQENAYLFLGRCYSYRCALPAEATQLVHAAQLSLPSNNALFLTLGKEYRKAAYRVPSASPYAVERKRMWLNAATTAVQAATQAEPSNATNHAILAKLLIKQRKYQQALAEIKMAQALAPNNQAVEALQPAERRISNDLAGALKSWLRSRFPHSVAPNS